MSTPDNNALNDQIEDLRRSVRELRDRVNGTSAMDFQQIPYPVSAALQKPGAMDFRARSTDYLPPSAATFQTPRDVALLSSVMQALGQMDTALQGLSVAVSQLPDEHTVDEMTGVERDFVAASARLARFILERATGQVTDALDSEYGVINWSHALEQWDRGLDWSKE